MTPKEKLNFEQVKTLQILLQHGSITKQQFVKSFTCMTEKMGMQGKINMDDILNN